MPLTPETQFWNEATGAASAVNSGLTFTGAARDVGVNAGGLEGFSYFNAFFLADQAGTAFIDASNDGQTWYNITSLALVASTPVTLTSPITTRFYRARVLNGGTNQGSLFVNTSFTAA